MDELTAYVHDAAATPFIRGDSDCCLFVARWIARRTGLDVSIGAPGACDDAGALAYIAACGGYARMVKAALRRLPVAPRAARGDVALLRLPRLLTVGIAMGAEVYAIKEQSGLIVAPCRPLRIWRV